MQTNRHILLRASESYSYRAFRLSFSTPCKRGFLSALSPKNIINNPWNTILHLWQTINTHIRFTSVSSNVQFDSYLPNGKNVLPLLIWFFVNTLKILLLRSLSLNSIFFLARCNFMNTNELYVMSLHGVQRMSFNCDYIIIYLQT